MYRDRRGGGGLQYAWHCFRVEIVVVGSGKCTAHQLLTLTFYSSFTWNELTALLGGLLMQSNLLTKLTV